MKKSILISVFSFTLGISGLAQACSEPTNKPEIPDPETAVTAQMVKANNSVREYVEEMTAYLNCARMSSAQHRRETRSLEEYAEEFNKAIRIFRARNE